MRRTTKQLLQDYNDHLDKLGPISIDTPAGPFTYLRSFALREISVDAYREGLNAYAQVLISRGFIIDGYMDNTEPGDDE